MHNARQFLNGKRGTQMSPETKSRQYVKGHFNRTSIARHKTSPVLQKICGVFLSLIILISFRRSC